jgi:MFS family permease
MTPSKAVYFLIELLNCYAAIYYSNFLFFYTRSRFGFGELENLLLAALNGCVYTVAAWKGGAFAQRHGGEKSLYVGFCGLAISMIAGLSLHSAWGQMLVLAGWTVSVCFVWPALEALVTDGASVNISDMVGVYNITWAFGGAAAYFTAGLLLERLGMQSLFWLPLAVVAVQLPLTPLAGSLAQKEKRLVARPVSADAEKEIPQERQFLHLAWLANPLSYVAINTIIPLVPTIAAKLHLSTGSAGIICSVWMFARLLAFAVLRRWTSWHYRFRFLAGSFVLLIAGFAGIVFARSIPLLAVSQVAFGLSVGLIYYSSLYYSMNASSERGAHGGLHEAMIGAGLFFGPASGAGALFLAPSLPGAGVASVGGLLVSGLAGLLWMRSRQLKKGAP